MDDTDFTKFWEAYPRKAGRPAAQKAWAKLNPAPATVAAILAAVEAQKETAQWRARGIIPNPARWLTDHRWEDGPEAKPETRGDKLARIIAQNRASGRVRGDASLYANLGTVAAPHPAGPHRVHAPPGKYANVGVKVNLWPASDTPHTGAPADPPPPEAPPSPPEPTPPPQFTAYVKFGRGFGERVKVGTAGSEAEARELAAQYQRDQGRVGDIVVLPLTR